MDDGTPSVTTELPTFPRFVRAATLVCGAESVADAPERWNRASLSWAMIAVDPLPSPTGQATMACPSGGCAPKSRGNGARKASKGAATDATALEIRISACSFRIEASPAPACVHHEFQMLPDRPGIAQIVLALDQPVEQPLLRCTPNLTERKRARFPQARAQGLARSCSSTTAATPSRSSMP